MKHNCNNQKPEKPQKWGFHVSRSYNCNKKEKKRRARSEELNRKISILGEELRSEKIETLI